MDLSRHLGVGIFNLTKRSSHLDSYRIMMSLAYTRSVKGMWYVSLYSMLMNDVAALSIVKVWLASTFDMKDLGEASYILGIKLIRDRNRKIMGLSQADYIDKLLTRFSMDNSKKGLLPFRHGLLFSKK